MITKNYMIQILKGIVSNYTFLLSIDHPSMILWFRYTIFNIIKDYYNHEIKIIHTGIDAGR